MPVSQARESFSGRAGWPIACAGLPPGSGQSGLTAGGGRITALPASFGSGSAPPPTPSTEIRSPGNGDLLSLNRSQPAAPSDSNSAANLRRFIAQESSQSAAGYDLSAADISAARA